MNSVSNDDTVQEAREVGTQMLHFERKYSLSAEYDLPHFVINPCYTAGPGGRVKFSAELEITCATWGAGAENVVSASAERERQQQLRVQAEREEWERMGGGDAG